MNIWSQFSGNPTLRRLALLHLIQHEVAPAQEEWFARCRINHCLAFPLASFDAVRFGLVAMVAGMSQAWLCSAAAIIAGAILVALQVMLNRRHRADVGAHIERLRLLRMIALWRSAVWGAVMAAMIVVAPPSMRLPLILALAFTTPFDAFSILSLPITGLAVASIQGTALVAVCLWLGGIGGIAAAGVTLAALAYIHWAEFNLYYMFATRRLRTRDLRERNETIQLLLNQYDEEGSDWLYECDLNGYIVNPSERFCAAAGLSKGELKGKRISDYIVDPHVRDRFRKRAWGHEVIRDEVIPLDFGGERRWWSISGRPVFDAEGNKIGRRGFISDVTMSQLAEQRVTQLAHYDALTGLPNRSLFATTLERAFARRKSAQLVAVLYIDLDHFKAINDTHGHNAGDAVLAQAAQRIEAAVPDFAMAARLGGDEFVVLLEKVGDRAEVLKIAETIVTAMDEPISIEDQIMPIGASVGIAFAPDNGLDGASVLQAADLALYDAKAKGRHGASLFDPAMQAEAQERRRLELDLRAALSRGELEVHYQPLIGMESGQPEGYEALLRWNHPSLGAVSPAVFIPIAEDTGQIVSIGTWVLREAMMEAACWPEHLFVSVNLSPAQMRDPALLGTIINALASSGLPAERLEIEITETTLMNDSKENLELLHKIRNFGVKISLDDFGTGYSSLNYLRSFPFDKIKIDRCFVSDLADKEDSDSIVNSVIELARKLNIRTLAEGVEFEDQLAKLRTSGCDQVQGFLYSKAVPADQLEHVRERADNALAGGDLIQMEQDSNVSLTPVRMKKSA